MGSMYILPLAKSAWPEGRVGPREKQDWYGAVVKAAKMMQTDASAQALVVTGFITATGTHESDIYLSAFTKFGIRPIVLPEGNETNGQLKAAMRYVCTQNGRLCVISTFLHYPRVRWICRGIRGVTHHVAWGIPRPKEAVTDLILIFAFPVLDILGLRTWFLDRVTKRRSQGLM